MILAIDTCGASGSVALGRVDTAMSRCEILAVAGLPGRGYSSRLIPVIGEVLAGRRSALRDIEAIVVVNGPGSFTGIRVGVSTAKGLAEATGIPLIAVSRLALLASACGLPHVIAAADAGRGEWYAGRYRNGRNLGETLCDLRTLMDAARQPGAGVLVWEELPGVHGPCPFANLAAERFSQGDPAGIPPPTAADALRLALERFLVSDFDDGPSLDANYLRRSDAEIFATAGEKPRIRPMDAQDLDRVRAIAGESAQSPPWTRLEYEQIFAAPESAPLRRSAVVATVGPIVAGFAVIRLLRGEVYAEMETITVDPRLRRRGIGSALMDACRMAASSQGMRGLRLEVRESNAAALALYRKHGFRSAGRRHAYYSAPAEDALLLEVRFLEDGGAAAPREIDA